MYFFFFLLNSENFEEKKRVLRKSLAIENFTNTENCKKRKNKDDNKRGKKDQKNKKKPKLTPLFTISGKMPFKPARTNKETFS